MDRSLTYPRSNFYESVVPYPELNEFAKQFWIPRQQFDGRPPDRAGDAPRLGRRSASALGGQYRAGHERRLVGAEEDIARGDFRRLRHAKAANVITILSMPALNVALRGIAVYG
jgi:hypothetical protein